MPPNPPDNLIDDYMLRLAGQLKSLPAAERNEHLRELRQHVEQLVGARASQADAVQSALSEMGDPALLGKDLLREWRSDNKKMTVSSYLLFAAFTLAMGYSVKVILLGIEPLLTVILYGVLPLTAALAYGWLLPGRFLRSAIWTGATGFIVLLTVFGLFNRELARISSSSVISYRAGHVYHAFDDEVAFAATYLMWWLAACVAAYVASSLKRRDWTLRLQ